MRLSALTLMLAALCLSAAAVAEEGMWTYDNFPVAKMRAKYGWAPDAAWLEHAQLASIRLTLGCSASLVSSDGLVMTNHHCARDCISELSDAQHDYVALGFYAAKPEDEKKCPAIEANQLVQISDVTKQIEAATAGKSDRAFHEAERAAKAQIESACGTAADVRCQVVTLYAGGVYDIYKYKKYDDVRLVFAPEYDAAFFGGDPDNFTFPRYDLDITFFRVYENDKPVHLDNYLQWSKVGVKDDDLIFVSGHPGGTDRLKTMAELRFLKNVDFPSRLASYKRRIDMLQKFGAESAETTRLAQEELFGLQNAQKAFKGEYEGLQDTAVMSQMNTAE